MECSNRGHCDRKTGQCDCFPGYLGEACRRTECPEDCSGHGRCQTVAQQAGSFTYALWDADMSRSCVCDPGFSGPDCADRACPIGDDPLTVKDSHNEVQFVEVFTEDDETVGTDGPFKGSVAFTYTDYWGAKWKTGPISLEPHTNGKAAGTGDKEANAAIALRAETALEALPNNVLNDVQVKVTECGFIIPGDKTIGNADVSAFDSVYTGAGYVNFPKHTFKELLTVESDSFTEVSSLSNYTSYPDTLSTTTYTGGDFTGTANFFDHAHCIRFHIYFVSTPGDLEDLEVDTSGVTVLNQDTGVAETSEQGATSVGHTVDDMRKLSGPISGTFISNGEVLTSTATSTDGTNAITMNGDTHYVNTHDRIRIQCGSKEIGTYTVSSSVAPTATTITTDEAIPACTAGTEMTISVVSHTFWINADLTGFGMLGEDGDDELIGAYLYYFGFTFGPITAIYWDDATLDTDTDRASSIGPFKGRLIMGNPLPSGYNGGYADISTTTELKQDAKGTSESSECSDRGICETDSGLCKCFGGYTGNACQKQNALSA
jgi:hypothetical protein